MRTRCLVIVILLCVIPAGLWALLRSTLSGYTRIELIRDDNREVLFSGILKNGERVILTWRNSQFGLDVTEAFFAREGLLIQDQVTFAAPDGAPPPRVSVADVDDLFHTGGAFDARGLSREFHRIVYRVGEIGDPKLRVQNRTISLRMAAGFGGRVILTADQPAVHDMF